MIKCRWIGGALGLVAWLAVSSMVACAVEPLDTPPSDPEPVGESQEAVGAGATCGPFIACDPGLLCCKPSPLAINGVCRNPQNDSANCASCGNACPLLTTCSNGICCPPFKIYVDGQCRTPCSVQSQCAAGQTCCAGAGYCA